MEAQAGGPLMALEKVAPKDQDEKDYQDYLDYQEYLGSQNSDEPLAKLQRYADEAKADLRDIPRKVGMIPSKFPKNMSDLRAMGEAAVAGPAQAITFGHLPQVAGKVDSLVSGRPYVEARDDAARYLNEVKARAPWTFGLTNLGANIAMPIKGGKSAVGAMTRGAIQGGLYNPGDEEGIVDPTQLDKRLPRAMLAGIGSGALKIGADAMGGAGRAALMRDRMAKPGFEKELQSEVKNAIGSMRRDYVSPRAQRVNNELRGTEIDFNPNILDRTSGVNSRGRSTYGLSNPAAGKIGPGGFPRETKSLQNSLRNRADPETGRVTMRGDKANRLRDTLEEKSGISSRGALGAPSVAARGSRQQSAANILRGKIREAAPQTRKDFDEMGYAIGVGREAMEKSKNPQSLLTGQYFGDMGSKLNDIDSFAGSNLRETGQDILRARYLTGQTPSTMPMVIREPVLMAENWAASASKPVAVAQKLLPKGLQNKLSPAALRTLLELQLSGPQYGEEGGEQ